MGFPYDRPVASGAVRAATAAQSLAVAVSDWKVKSKNVGPYLYSLVPGSGWDLSYFVNTGNRETPELDREIPTPTRLLTLPFIRVLSLIVIKLHPHCCSFGPSRPSSCKAQKGFRPLLVLQVLFRPFPYTFPKEQGEGFPHQQWP